MKQAIQRLTIRIIKLARKLGYPVSPSTVEAVLETIAGKLDKPVEDITVPEWDALTDEQLAAALHAYYTVTGR